MTGKLVQCGGNFGAECGSLQCSIDIWRVVRAGSMDGAPPAATQASSVSNKSSKPLCTTMKPPSATVRDETAWRGDMIQRKRQQRAAAAAASSSSCEVAPGRQKAFASAELSTTMGQSLWPAACTGAEGLKRQRREAARRSPHLQDGL
jgi:hypothetical protein